MADNRVICVGCALWDTIFSVDHIPSRGTKILPRQAVQAASGMATAAAVSIARLGGPVALWARIGDDATGTMLIEDLSQSGVCTAWIRQVPGGRTPFSTILVDRDGERLVVPFIDPALEADAAWLPLEDIAGAAAVMADMRWLQGARAALTEARRVGVPTILDADVAAVEDLKALMPLADHLLFSEPALRLLADNAKPEDALLALASHTDAKVIGVTLGERGSLIWQRDVSSTEVHHFPTPRIRAVDTLNAGDVWHGTYAYGLAHGWALADSVRAASVAAAMKCEVFGGYLGAPRMAELVKRMASAYRP
ncbi:MAG: PfkB family carbohydrate kinase [Pseudomonas sp.]|nr:PfkB family carbohydrate kinase [Pseudomonas sp.]